MTAVRKQQLKRGGTIVLLSLAIHAVALATLPALADFATVNVDERGEEPDEVVSEYVFDESESTEAPPESDDTAPADIEADVIDALQEELRTELAPEEPTDRSEPVEEAPEVSEELEVEQVVEAVVIEVPPEERFRQSVHQPEDNNEAPTTEDFYLAAVDNSAEVETQVQETHDGHSDGREERSSGSTDEHAVSDGAEVDHGVVSDVAGDDIVDVASADPDDREGADDGNTDHITIAQDSVQLGDSDQQTVAMVDVRAGPRGEQERVHPNEAEPRPAMPLQGELTEGEAPADDVADEGTQAAAQPDPSASNDGVISLSEAFDRALERAESGSGDGGPGAARQAAMVGPEAFDATFGDRVQRSRTQARQRARARSMLGDHEGDWQRTREALENYDIAVTAGTETHLNTRRDDHAPFLNRLHSRLHPQWWQFLATINSTQGQHSLDDMSLRTRVEVRVGEAGHIDRVRIVRSSGNTYFDADAVRIMYSLSRTAAPPPEILCSDGNVYVHWTLSRAPDRCGTFNASVRCPG